jgi:hypothetical protein
MEESFTDDSVSVYLRLMSQKAKVRAFPDFKLVDQTTGLSSWIARPCSPKPDVFDTTDIGGIGTRYPSWSWGYGRIHPCTKAATINEDELITAEPSANLMAIAGPSPKDII